jgi:hypothetical protein
MAISRMQEPRQLYGLGSLVKKATRGIKKIAKSPLGKAALFAAGAYGLGALGGASSGGGFLKALQAGRANFGLGRIGTGLKTLALGNKNILGGQGLFGSKGVFSPKRTFLTAGLAASTLPFMMGGDEEVEEEVEMIDPVSIRQKVKDYYRTGANADEFAFLPDKRFVQRNFYAAQGGLAEDEEEEDRSMIGQVRKMPKTFLNMGGGAGNQQAQQMLMMEYVKYKNQGGDMSFEQFVKAVMQASQEPAQQPRVMAQEGGIMDTEEAEMIDMGGMEKDYRNTGGFVEMGGEERADDVPARLSKNEFVFTADAVRNAGGGDIDKGAEVMENLMNNLEQGGEVSEDSQGLEGAQAMYDQMKQLESRVI